MNIQEEQGVSMLQQEKNIRTQMDALVKEKNRRMQQLKTLLEQDQDLCDILCSMPYGVAPDCVPSLEQLENFSQHIANQNTEKVEASSLTSTACFCVWWQADKNWKLICFMVSCQMEASVTISDGQMKLFPTLFLFLSFLYNIVRLHIFRQSDTMSSWT